MAKKENNETFIFHTAYIKKFKKLTLTQLGKLLKAMCEYTETKKVPEISDADVMFAFDVVKYDLDRNAEKYADTCERNKKAIQRRWEKQKEAQANTNDTSEYARIQPNTNDTYNDNDNDNDNGKNNIIHSECDNNSAPAPKENTDFKLYGICGNVKLTDKEMKELTKKYPELYEDYIDRVSLHKKSEGREYDNDFATVMKWIRQDKSKEKAKEKNKRKEDCINDRSEYGNSDGLYESFAAIVDDAKS